MQAKAEIDTLFTSHFLKLRRFSKPAFYLVRSLTVLSAAIFCLSFVLEALFPVVRFLLEVAGGFYPCRHLRAVAG